MPYNPEQRRLHDKTRVSHGEYIPKEREPTLHALMTHDEVAKELGINRQRVQAIERNALRKLKKCKLLREYWHI